MSSPSVSTTAYEALATEYYNSILHPTCANFRYASEQLIRPWLEKLAGEQPICEVGVGMSVVAELLLESNSTLENLYLTDSVGSMLEYSRKWEAVNLRTFVAEAGNLPFAANTFGLCVSSLGDPYNTVELWPELARVLLSDGYAIYTTPSYEWASCYRRTASDSLNELAAEFFLSDGRTIFAPSIVHNQGDQVKLIESSHLMEVVDFQVVRYSQLPPVNISPKLQVAQENDLPVVSGYLVRRA